MMGSKTRTLFVVLRETPDRAAQSVGGAADALGVRLTQSYGPRAMIVEAEPEAVESLAAHPSVAGVFEGPVPDDAAGDLDETGRLGAAAWSERQQASYRASKRRRKGEGLAWDHPDYESEG